MREKLLSAGLVLVALLAVPRMTMSQAMVPNGTLIVSGQPGRTPVLQVNGKTYVDIETLARLTNGSLSFKGREVTLTLPGLAPSASSTAPPSQASNSEFTIAFLKACSTQCP